MPHIRLREVRDDDLAVFYEHQRDPEATAMASFPARERDAFFAHWARIRVNDTATLRTVVAGEEVVGNVVAWQDGGRTYVGYWIGREHWGGGIGTAALEQFVRVASVRPLHALVAAHNAGSIRVLEKCGFVRADETREDEFAYVLEA